MKNFCIILLLSSIFLSCDEGDRKKPEGKVDQNYNIIDDSNQNDYGRDYPRRVLIGVGIDFSMRNINNLSDSIIYHDRKHDKFDIYFYSLDKDGEYNNLIAVSKKSYNRRAEITHFERTDPKEKTFNYNKTEPQEKTYTANTVGMESLGVWKERNSNTIVVLYKKNGEYYLHSRFPDNSDLMERLVVKTKNGQKTYNVVGDDSEYMIIKKDGIYVYDMYGDLGLIYHNF